jgi:chemotaxis protein MotB
MQSNGIRSDQIMQVRGFADQRLRKSDAPLDPAKRRISVIVQYIVKNNDDDDTERSSSGESKQQASPSRREVTPPAALTR